MTGQDWYRLLDQGFKVEIAPPCIPSKKKKNKAPRKIPYGYVTKCAREFIGTGRAFSKHAKFAAQKKIPPLELRQAIYNLRRQASHPWVSAGKR